MPLQFISDDKGNKIAVILPIDEYQRICEALKELESIRAYDAAKALNSEAIPFEQAIKETEKARMSYRIFIPSEESTKRTIKGPRRRLGVDPF